MEKIHASQIGETTLVLCLCVYEMGTHAVEQSYMTSEMVKTKSLLCLHCENKLQVRGLHSPVGLTGPGQQMRDDFSNELLNER